MCEAEQNSKMNSRRFHEELLQEACESIGATVEEYNEALARVGTNEKTTQEYFTV